MMIFKKSELGPKLCFGKMVLSSHIENNEIIVTDVKMYPENRRAFIWRDRIDHPCVHIGLNITDEENYDIKEHVAALLNAVSD